MEDTIAAVATAYGEGGIGIVRVSGPEARQILKRIFVPEKQEWPANRTLAYGRIVDRERGKTLDECLAVFMKGPHTYTAEDVAEINCHGSVIALQEVLSLTLRCGARLAEPGEFTKRAFLNGRLDLSQAEAVIDLVRAKTDKGFDVAMDQLEGALSGNIQAIRSKLLDLLVKAAVNIDYPDEDIEELTYRELTSEISQISDMIEKLLATAAAGKMIREGLQVIITGKPNVGKSSLMNALLQENRAIVTEIPGTTRDTIEESVNIKGIPVRLTDTAGIRETEDRIEKIGVERSKKAFNQADLIILVLDGSQALAEEDLEIIKQIGNRKAIFLLNKIDLGQSLYKEEVAGFLQNAEGIETSMTQGTGIDQIREKIQEQVYGGQVKQADRLLITNARHKRLLEKAREALADAVEMAGKGEALDFMEVDLKAAYEHLGEIVGETVSEDVIDAVFARFCLGK